MALEDLPKSQYQAEINKLKQSGEEAGKQSYQILISILKKQGFEYGRKKRPLATRLAEIFNIDRAQVTRDKTTFGLQDD